MYRFAHAESQSMGPISYTIFGILGMAWRTQEEMAVLSFTKCSSLCFCIYITMYMYVLEIYILYIYT